MTMPEQSGDSFDFCVLFRVYFTGKGAVSLSLLRFMAASVAVGYF